MFVILLVLLIIGVDLIVKKNKKELSLNNDDIQALELARKQRKELLSKLNSAEKELKLLFKDMKLMELNALDASRKRHMDMTIKLIELSIKLVDQRLKVLKESNEVEMSYKSLLLEVMKLKKEMEELNATKRRDISFATAYGSSQTE